MIDTTCYITLHYITLKICSLPQVLFGEKVLCHSCSQPFWWQMFSCSWTTYLDQLPASLWDKKSAVQNSEDNTENIHVSDGLRRIVTFLIIAPMCLINTLTYLLTTDYELAVIQFNSPYRTDWNQGHCFGVSITAFRRTLKEELLRSSFVSPPLA